MSAASPALKVIAVKDEPHPLDLGASALFELIGNSPLVAEGKALLVSIDPIKTALGIRWDARREHIHEVVERHFRKHLSDSDILLQASETHILVGTPEKSAMVAQAVCYRALKEVLTHFLGAVDPANLRVNLVTELTGDHIAVRPVSAAELEKADAEAVFAPPPVPGGNGEASALNSLKAWPLKSADGRQLRVSFAVDPVIDLRSGNVAGHRVESRILDLERGSELGPAERRALLPPDFARIDLAALARGMSQLTERDAGRPSLVMQLSFVGLSNRRASTAIFEHARAVEHVLKRAVVCELVDIEEGIPAGRLAEMTALVRPFFRAVWVQVEPNRALIGACKEARATGLTVRAGAFGEDNRSIALGLRRFMKMAEGAAPALTVTSLPARELLMEAMAMGFSHATLRVPNPSAAESPTVGD
ncbi:MAG TPA: hypothetical protein VL358_08605 [Caulobacteraceae bacterium]|jgi:hypothetical protein|nr:hypothetical protein [Caulobacteraceae bacterium]